MAKEKNEKPQQSDLSDPNSNPSESRVSYFAPLVASLKSAFATALAVERDSPLDAPTAVALSYVRIKRLLSKGEYASTTGDFATAVESVTSSIDMMFSTESIDLQAKNAYAQLALKIARSMIVEN